MKYLLITLTSLLLLNCADNITNNTTQTYEDQKTWCTVEQYKNGEPREIYKIGDTVEKLNEYPEYFSVVVDSTAGDSIFINTTAGKKVIIDEPYSTIDQICIFNEWYEIKLEFDGYSKLYYNCDEIKKCEE